MAVQDINLAGRISHFFAVNRPLSLLLLLVSLVLGLVAFLLTPKQYNPEIVRPAFAVSVAYEGATVVGAVDRVVYELVEKINTVPGVDDVYTQVSDGAVINTTVIFSVGYDTTKAKLDLLSQLDQHSYLARGSISRPQIIEINPETIPVLQIAFGSADLSIAELRSQVITLSHQLGGVSEVSELQVYGGYEPALVVEVNVQQLAAADLSFSALTNTLSQSQSQIISTGVRNDSYVTEVVFDGVISTPEAVGDLLVVDGVKVRDVAKVYEGVAGSRSYVFYQDLEKHGEVVMLSVAKVEGSSAPVVTDNFLTELDIELLKTEFSGLEYRVVGDDGVTAEREIFGLTKNLVTSIAIVTMVLLLFLSTRAAIVVLVAIPTTLLIVFGLGLLFEQTINRITLFALILSLGLLVDSAIVAVENIYSHLRQWKVEPAGKTREQVIASAIDEIGVGLLLSTVTSVIVFLPLNFISGMMGPYMGPIAFFVPAALIVSFFVAIIITPFVANQLLDTEESIGRVGRIFSRLLEKVTASYSRLLRSILFSVKKQKIILRSALGIFIISLILPMTGMVHFQMLPRADLNQFYVYVDLPVDTDRKETKRVTELLSGILLTDEEVVDVQQYVATAPILDFNGMFKGAQNRVGANQATVRVDLTLGSERSRSSNDVVNTLRQMVTQAEPAIATKIRFIEEPPGPPVQATLVAKVVADDEVVRQEVSDSLQALIAPVTGVVDLDSSTEDKVGRVQYIFDYVAAAELGVSPDQVAEVIGVLNGSYEVSEFIGADGVEYVPLVLKLPAEQIDSPNFIDAVTVVSKTGEAVPLRSVLKVEYEERPSMVYLEDAQPLTYVAAEVQDRSIIYVTIEIIKLLLNDGLGEYEVVGWNLWDMQLQSPNGELVEIVWGGEWEMTLENFRDLGIAMGVALLMVYALLVAQYNTFRTPAFILVTVPLGLVGILWGFLVLDVGFGIYLTATALIGFIALIGLVVNNAIIFLEYVGQAEANGLEYREALLAAGEARLRPIFLTSLTTVLGSLTIASDPVWSGLAWAIIFGLSLSTILTLVIYPTLLVYFRKDN